MAVGRQCPSPVEPTPSGRSPPTYPYPARQTRPLPSTGSKSFPVSPQDAQQAQQWVNELAEELDWREQRSYCLIHSVLHILRDWLTLKEMTDLAAQLPVLIRDMFFEGWTPNRTPAAERKKEDFVARIQTDFERNRLSDPDAAIAAVFKLLDRHVSSGEIAQVRHSMNKHLQLLWPEAK